MTIYHLERSSIYCVEFFFCRKGLVGLDSEGFALKIINSQIIKENICTPFFLLIILCGGGGGE
jgi:hypothetical protein